MRERILHITFTWLLGIVGSVAMWPIFADWWLFVVTGTGLFAATFLAWASHRYRWGALTNFISLGLTYLVLGVLVAAPDIYKDPLGSVPTVLGVVTAPVTGWTNLLTLELPLGTFQAVLAPVLLLYLVIPFCALLATHHTGWLSALAPLLMLGLSLVAILFGSSVYEPFWQTLFGVVSFMSSLVWLVVGWITARKRAAVGSGLVSLGGANQSGRGFWLRIRGTVTGTLMLAVAVTVGVTAGPALTEGSTRDVLRTSFDPDVEIQQMVSPLTTYRSYFDDEAYDTTLFTVEAPQQVTRIRFATLDVFNGETFRPGFEDTGFRRVPSTIPLRGGAQPAAVTLNINEYPERWVPLAGNLQSIEFVGNDRAALTDGFFYRESSETGVQLSESELKPGHTIRMDVIPVQTGDIRDFQPSRQAASIEPHLVPQSLTQWLSEQAVTRDGAGLQDLIDRLRARGYLSHSVIIEGETPRWVEDLPGYAFEPSRAGHSSDRVGRLFTDLNTRAQEMGVEAADSELVAAVGDDEQFAVAAALLADQLGFDTRVALGVRLESAESDPLPTCELGVCDGRHVAAWLEVRDAGSGEWSAVDVTPQHEHPPVADTILRSDPQNPTDVRSRHPQTVPPPEATPQGTVTPPDEEASEGSWWELMWPVAKPILATLLALVLLLTPFLLIPIVKIVRKRMRRRAPDEQLRVLSGWEELVDRAVDEGLPHPSTSTRLEYVTVISTGEKPEAGAQQLATLADTASFAGLPVSAEDADRFWRELDRYTGERKQRLALRRRIRAALSLRSLKRLFTSKGV